MSWKAVAALCLFTQAVAGFPPVLKPRVVAWYTGVQLDYPPEAIDFQTVTHLVYSGGGVEFAPSGASSCNTSNISPFAHRVLDLARSNGAKLQFVAPKFLVQAIDNMTMRGEFMGTIRKTLEDCGYNGMEFDWEGPTTLQMADRYTDMLIELRAAIGADAVVSVDSEPANWNPPDYYTLNATKLFQNGEITVDFVNFMTYHPGTEDHSLTQWQDCINGALKLGFPPSTINVALGFYADGSGPKAGHTWREFCALCPDIDPASNNCSGTSFVGKQTAEDVGKLIRKTGIGGAFPWILDYDASPLEANSTWKPPCGDDSILKWLKKGLA